MLKTPKCLLKINKKLFEENQPELKQKEESISKPIAEQKEPEQQEEEEELSFNDFIMEEEQEQEEQQDEEYIKQQKKIGLMCHCGLTSVLREVKKDGPNKEKLFYTCSKSYEEKCNYFMWKDESDKKRGINVNIKSTQSSVLKDPELCEERKESTEEHDEKYYKQQQKMGLMCYCKLSSVSREVKKDGANKGKIFYTCSRYFDDKCKYFVWKDEIKK
jgi:ethanolamine utilization protein EutQ (cupin superfamily)